MGHIKSMHYVSKRQLGMRHCRRGDVQHARMHASVLVGTERACWAMMRMQQQLNTNGHVCMRVSERARKALRLAK